MEYISTSALANELDIKSSEHLVFADTQSPNEKPKELKFCQRSTE